MANQNGLNTPNPTGQSGSQTYAADSVGTDTYAATLDPVPIAYVDGMLVNIKIGTANTGAATMDLNSLGAIAITKAHEQPLVTGDIEAGQIISLVYNSTGPKFQMQSVTAQTTDNLTGTANEIDVTAGGAPQTASLSATLVAPGTVTLNADPTNPLEAATKQYVDGTASAVFDGYFNTLVLERWVMTATSDGATWTCTLTGIGVTDLTIAWSTGLATFDATPAASVTLTTGTDATPVLNYVYIPISTKLLTASAVSWPAEEYASVATILCQSAATGAADEPYKVHGWHDDVTEADDSGHSAALDFWIRAQSATWISGAALTPTAGVNQLDIAVAAGNVLQLHQNDFPALDTGGAAHVNVVNDPGTAYLKVTDMSTIQTDASGGSMSNRRYNLVIWGVVSEDASQCKLFVNLPTDTYGNDNSAIEDPNRTTVFNIPSTFTGTGFLISRLTVRRINSSSTLSILQNEDLRGLTPSVATGSGTGGITAVVDDPAPTLGGNLNGGAFDITNVANLTVTTNIIGSALTASRAVATGASKELASSATTDTELGYVSGVTSAIQTQLDDKISQDGAQVFAADAEASDTYVITLSPVPSGYTTGMVVSFSANTANTDGATINVNSLGAKAILKNHDVALATGDIEAGQLVTLIYDGTQFQMQSQLGQEASGGGASAASQAEQETGTAVDVFVSPGRQQYHDSATKGWCKADVTGGVDGSYNVTSVTDDGTGQITFNWATDFSDGNYSVVVEGYSLTSNIVTRIFAVLAVGSTKAVSVVGATLNDPLKWFVIACGDQ